MRTDSPRPARSRRILTRAALLTAATLAAASCLPPRVGTSSPRLSERDKAIHLLSRATYGVRAVDVEEVMRIGRNDWLEQQLQPERIDDGALETRIASRPAGSQQGLVATANVMRPPSGSVPAPMPNAVRPEATMQVLVEALRRAGKQLETTQQGLESARRRVVEAQQIAERQGVDSARVIMETARVELATAQRLATEAQQQFELVRQQFSAATGQGGMQQQAPAVVRVVSPTQALNTLVGLKLERAVYSRRQLQEVMTDFWFNHFNVFYNKGQVRLVLDDYEKNAIRQNVFGRFEDMLVATAQHPAMMVYLDNYLSTAPTAQPQRSPARGARQRGLNENYARELLELHTLGVAGGYTQQDVVEVARAFTGWGIVNRTVPRAAGAPAPNAAAVDFQFNEGQHDTGDKVVLGQPIAGGRGMEEGLEILGMLARHPSTAQYVATKLVRHFVSDDPPAELVDEIAAVFMDTDGDLAAVTRALFLADEFYDPTHYRSKVKRPFEFVASALRVVEANVQPQGQGLVPQLRSFRHVPYSEAAPTGYATTAEEWVSAGALLSRMNFALDLVGGRLPGISVSGEAAPAGVLSVELQPPAGAATSGGTPTGGAPRSSADVELQMSISELLERIHFGVETEQLAALIAEDLTRPRSTPADAPAIRGPATPGRTAGRRPPAVTPVQRAVALALGSPEFQRY